MSSAAVDLVFGVLLVVTFVEGISAMTFRSYNHRTNQAGLRGVC